MSQVPEPEHEIDERIQSYFADIFELCLLEHDEDNDEGSHLPFIAAVHDKKRDRLIYFSTLNKRMTQFCSEQMSLALDKKLKT